MAFFVTRVSVILSYSVMRFKNIPAELCSPPKQYILWFCEFSVHEKRIVSVGSVADFVVIVSRTGSYSIIWLVDTLPSFPPKQ